MTLKNQTITRESIHISSQNNMKTQSNFYKISPFLYDMETCNNGYLARALSWSVDSLTTSTKRLMRKITKKKREVLLVGGVLKKYSKEGFDGILDLLLDKL